jgi:hypothetical protein
MSLFSAPSAAKTPIRARCAKPCAVLRRDAKPSSSRRSLSLNSLATAVLLIANPPRINQRRESHLEFAELKIRSRPYAIRLLRDARPPGGD